MRNRVIHGYASVDAKIVWDSVTVDIPELRRQIAGILESLDGASETT
jgi:uncharacterized protein with HEPN domain